MDLKNHSVVLASKRYLDGAKVPYTVIAELEYGVAMVQYTNGETHYLFDRDAWECSHSLLTTKSIDSPDLGKLNLGKFPYQKRNGSDLAREHYKKFLVRKSADEELVKKRRERAADEDYHE